MVDNNPNILKIMLINVMIHKNKKYENINEKQKHKVIRNSTIPI